MNTNNPNSFLLYLDSLSILDELSDAEAGQLFKAIWQYMNGVEVELPQMLKIAFIPIRNYLDRNTERYNDYIEKQRINGRKGGRPKNPTKPKKPKPFFENPTKPKKADRDRDRDRDNIITAKKEAAPGLKSAADLVGQILPGGDQEKHAASYWQERALYFIEKLKIPAKDHSIIFGYFKRNHAIMESICSFVLESSTPIKNPMAYVLSEYKRRAQVQQKA